MVKPQLCVSLASRLDLIVFDQKINYSTNTSQNQCWHLSNELFHYFAWEIPHPLTPSEECNENHSKFTHIIKSSSIPKEACKKHVLGELEQSDPERTGLNG